jgi:hypothetical protein
MLHICRLSPIHALAEIVGLQLGIEELVDPVVDRSCFVAELPRNSEDCWIRFASRISIFSDSDMIPRQEEMCINLVAKLPRELEEMAFAECAWSLFRISVGSHNYDHGGRRRQICPNDNLGPQTWVFWLEMPQQNGKWEVGGFKRISEGEGKPNVLQSGLKQGPPR